MSLAVAPAVRADDGGPAAAAPSPASAVEPQGQTGDEPPGKPGEAPGQAKNGSDAAAAPSSSSSDGGAEPSEERGNSGDAPGQGADPAGKAEEAPGQAKAAEPPGQAKAEEPPGQAKADGKETPPRAEADQAASIEQDAGASAAADQEKVGNKRVDVRIDDPGNGKAVGQENRADADADASASAIAVTPGEASARQEAEAEAAASQSDVENTVVVVRVASSGDDGPVSQSNVASAIAQARADGPGQSEEWATATAAQDDTENTNVSVRVFSPGDDGSVTQLNEASAEAQTGTASGEDATATQDGVRNTSVSIRVESPGSTGPVNQLNDVRANGGTAVAVTDDAVNTVVAVTVDGSALDRPGSTGLQVWVWEWVWQRDESESLAGLFGEDVSSWTWIWDGQAGNGNGRGTVTSREAGDDDNGGTWNWRWSWDRQVAGWSWSWNWNESLSCSSCVWIWNWSWSWTGAPSESSAAPSVAPVGTDPPGQSNVASATAEAAVAVEVDQSVGQDGSGAGAQYAGQLIDVVQFADAVAVASQTDVASVTYGQQLVQSNVVTSAAAAILDATLAQEAEQYLAADGTATADQWSGQEIELAQIADAKATASQQDAVLTGSGRYGAVAQSSADGTSAVEQLADQTALVDGGETFQWIGQLTIVEQASEATSTVDQAGTPRSRSVGGTATSSASAGGLALVEQNAQQAAARSGGVGDQSAAQLVYVGQDGSARATTAQQAGAAAQPLASSEATAVNRAALVQEASQHSVGASPFDIQDLLQQSIVIQTAVAGSTSNGGIAGAATVVNCATTHQSAGQSLGAGPTAPSTTDLSRFCFPETPAPAPTTPADTPSAASVPTTSGAPTPPQDAAATQAAPEDDLLFHRGRIAAAFPTRSATSHAPAPRRVAPSGPHAVRPDHGSPAASKLSGLPSTQARLDTRPGSHAGDGDAGREPPLPPAGDPPMWISALATAASSAGPSGIAAILLAFSLVPPLLMRAREGSVVRRPTDVLARVDVPV